MFLSGENNLLIPEEKNVDGLIRRLACISSHLRVCVINVAPPEAAIGSGGSDEGHKLLRAAEGRGEKYRPGSVTTVHRRSFKKRTNILSLKNNVESFIED